MDGAEREVVMSATREVPIRDSAPPQSQSSRTLESSHNRSWSSGLPDLSRQQSSNDVWSGALHRIQSQVSLNTSMLETHRRQLQEVDVQVRGLSRDFHELRNEMRARLDGAGPAGGHDAGDLELLVGQVEAVTNKANEVDALKMQLELMKNRMKRLEEQGPPPATGPPFGHHPRPSTSSTHRESSVPEVPPPMHHMPHAPHHHHSSLHQQLPPMRTASMVSPGENRPPAFPPPHGPPPVPILESHGRAPYRPPDPRQPSSESPSTMQPGGFRPVESLPPPSTLPGWRSSDSVRSGGFPPPPPAAGPVRPPTLPAEPQATGWASVNANQHAKRPFEEPRRSPYESPGSPKRPKLAPIMPRASYGEESFVPLSVTPSKATDASSQHHDRAPSDGSQTQAQNLGTPASTNAHSYRFITSTSTTQADSQESWRPEHERRLHGHHHHPPHHHGRHGRGRRGGRGGRRGRGGGVQLPETQQEIGSPEWEKSQWTGSQISPNGYYHPLNPHKRREGAQPVAEPSNGPEGEYENPETPIQDPSVAGTDEAGQAGSAGKKTRTKPIRNAEGVLIRKDGRPDMRSVSSANNLRKVHAKKEAERAEMDGRTPTSSRSLAPAQYSDDENGAHSDTPGTPLEQDEGEEMELGEQGREPTDESQTAAQRHFPSEGQQQPPDVVMKSESDQRQNGSAEQQNSDSQMTDAVMREMSDAQAEDHRQRDNDTKMATVDEAEEDRERGNDRQGLEQQAAELPTN